jgi:RNA polymerase sigma-70 factor (ECF subfamily)
MLAAQNQSVNEEKDFLHKSKGAPGSVDTYVTAEIEKRKQFEGMFMPFIDGLYSMALRMTRNQDDAEDLVQETYLKAFRFFDNFRTNTNARAWIITIMMNTFRTRYRKIQKEPTAVDFDAVENLLSADQFDSNGLPANKSELRDIESINEYMRSVVSDDVMKALDSVPERFRIPVLLSDAEQFNYQEISEILGINMGTVKSRIFRGRKLLKKSLIQFAASRGIGRQE